MWEFMALCLFPAFVFSAVGFLFRRLNLGHVSLAFVIIFVAGVVSVFVAKRETEIKVKAEANLVASQDRCPPRGRRGHHGTAGAVAHADSDRHTDDHADAHADAHRSDAEADADADWPHADAHHYAHADAVSV